MYLYIREDDNTQTYSISLQGTTRLANYVNRAPGKWHKLGPWAAVVTNGTIKVQAEGPGIANLCGIEVRKVTVFPTPLSTDQVTARLITIGTEDRYKAFDKNINTKYYDYNPSGTTWIQYQFASGVQYVINQYTITSANDVPTRDPKNWTLQGSNDGINYTILHTVTNASFNTRKQKLAYPFTNTVPYNYYKLVVSANNGDLKGIQLSEIELLGPSVNRTDAPGGGLVTARLGSTGFTDRYKAFDQNINTKYYDYNASGTTWIQYQFANKARYVINQYNITSGSDMLSRNPKNWTLKGSHDGISYTILHTVTNADFGGYKQTLSYSFTNTMGYQYYKLDVTANNGATTGVQFSELELIDASMSTSSTLRIASDKLHRLEAANLLHFYPNPSTDKVHIEFTTVSSEAASLELYDSKGVLVKQLFKGKAEAEKVNHVEVNGSQLHSGIYIIRLVTTEKVEVQKLILTK